MRDALLLVIGMNIGSFLAVVAWTSGFALKLYINLSNRMKEGK